MKYRGSLLFSCMILLSVMLLGGYCYAQDYVPSAKEELYGTWTNEKQSPQKTVNFTNGFKDFALLSDSVPVSEGTEKITSKWKDSQGNIWYKTLGTGTGGESKGYKWQTLQKLSKSGKMRELVDVLVGEFDSNSYPTTIDQKDGSYRLFYRAEK